MPPKWLIRRFWKKISARRIRNKIMASILALHGPNLNLLGSREPHIYGSDTLEDINERLSLRCADSGHQFDSLQSNSEGEIIDRLHAARKDGTAFMIVNFGGFTHTSIAIRDAILACEIPFIEVHLSNLFSREEYRHHSYFSDIAVGCVIGLGAQGYELALQAACRKLDN
jgi:3-dehydroquinate dehydratase-2